MADSRGTRGFVTTADDSTGSVGESRAPTRNDSVQPRSVTTCVTSATNTHVSGMASASLRNGRCHALLEHLLLHLEPVAEQDHDQRDHREALDELPGRIELEHLEAALPEHEPRDHEERRQGQE